MSEASRQWTLDGLTAAQLPSDSLTTLDGSLFRSLAIDNNSSCAIEIWLDRAPTGPASLSVPAYFYKVLPIGARLINVAAAATSASPAGSTYIHASGEVLAAAACALSSGNGALNPS